MRSHNRTKRHTARHVARKFSIASRDHKARRISQFVPKNSSVLLVGVSRASKLGNENQVERSLLPDRRVTALVYEDPQGFELPSTVIIRGDAVNLPFVDKSFDYVVSNAVIEHVGGPVAAEKMVSEALRVARVGAIHTTPNRWFPIETHTLIPLAHWLPRSTYAYAFRLLGRPSFTSVRYWLMSKREFAVITGGVIEGWPRIWPIALISRRSVDSE